MVGFFLFTLFPSVLFAFYHECVLLLHKVEYPFKYTPIRYFSNAPPELSCSHPSERHNSQSTSLYPLLVPQHGV
jgi:hypothetical protein